MTVRYLNYKTKITSTDRVYLTSDELQKMINKRLSNDRLTQVRDIFLFCCFTVLAYTNVQKLKKQDLVIGVNGEQWISIKRQKTDTPAHIPLLP